MANLLDTYPRTVQAARVDQQYRRLAKQIDLPGMFFSLIAMVLLSVSACVLISANENAGLPPCVLAFALSMLLFGVAASSLIVASLFLSDLLDGTDGRGFSLVSYYGLKRFGVTRQYARVAAELIDLQAQAQNLQSPSDDTLGQIMATRITALQKDIAYLLAQTEGIDGQANTPFGVDFLHEINGGILSQNGDFNQINAALVGYASAKQFDNAQAQELAMELVGSRLGLPKK